MYSRAASLGITSAYGEVAENIPDNAAGSELVLEGYSWYQQNSTMQSNTTNGYVFECLILDALWKVGINPMYHQATVTRVPNAKYDIFLYHPEVPVVISCKTSLRERWKQAAIEGWALQFVYLNSKSYLVTFDEDEGDRTQRKIEQGNVVGIDECVVIGRGRTRFDELLVTLMENHDSEPYTEATPVVPVSGRIVR